ncbi:unnamed protein product, partial [Vitis vinifera]
MGVGRAGFSICFLILLFVLVVGSSEAKRRTAKTFFSNRAYEVAMEIDEDTAEQVWIQCRQELMEMNYAVEEFDLCFIEEEMSGSSEMNPKAALLLKRNVHKAINSLAPQMKESLLDCLRTKNLIFSVSGDEVPSKSWFIKYLELLFGWSNRSRRHLANVPQLTIETSPDSAPGPDQDPALVDSGIYYGPAPAANSKLPPLGPHHRKNTASGEGDDVTGESDAPKTKLKPFFWDKVLASPDESMVWHELSAGSFQFNEEMIESLFGYTNVEKNKNDSKKESASSEPQYIQIINPKKAQNLSILLRALNVTTEEVYDALKEGNELPAELLQTLLKMAPTPDEELKLRLFSGNTSQLGPAERFLKVLVEIPFAFKRMEALLFMSSLQEEVSGIKESFAALEVACKELRNSRLFLKLLEAVLKTGNRMNDGTFRGGAQAFKLDTLLKLSDVKGIDGKTTLLHFVVLEIIRSEGIRAARAARESKSFSSLKSDDLTEDPSNETEHFRTLGLQVVSGLSNELENVKKAAIIDADSLTSTVSNLGDSLLKTRDFLRKDMRKDEGLRLFAIVRDFLKILDKVCNEVRKSTIKPTKNPKTEAPTVSAHPEVHQSSLQDMRQKLFPVIAERRMDNSSSSSSDDDSPSS